MDSIKVTNKSGIPFNVRIVNKGDRYGRDGVLIHDKDDKMVEFYDARYDHDKWIGLGQFVSRYYLSTLNEREVDFEGGSYGLNLDGGVDGWEVSGENMDNVLGWIDYKMMGEM